MERMQPQVSPGGETEIPAVDLPEIPEINRTEIGEDTIHPGQASPVATKGNVQDTNSRDTKE